MKARLFALGVAFASFATIALELMLTRIYSVTMYYHFAYMVISLALLGLAVSGVVIYLLPRVFEDKRVPMFGAGFMLLFALGARWALDGAVQNPISLSNWQANTDKLLAIFVPAGLCFLASGFALSLAITSARDNIGRIYAYDLIGAAAGCLFVIPALPSLGGPGAILMVGAFAAAAAVLFALSSSPAVTARAASYGAAGLAAVICLWMAYSAATEKTERRFGLARNPEKFLGNREVLFEKWNALSQITVGPGGHDHHWIFIDADAATRLWSGEIKKGGYESPRQVGEVRVAALVYALRHDGTALIIGPGGGTDVISALYHGAPRVVGVEVNPIIVDSIMKGRFAEYSGNLYSDPRVEVLVDEGRSYIRRATEPFASIQATLIDTWAASSSGAFTLSENNLYTVEAFGEFLDHLRTDGIITVTRWYDAGAPKEFLRLVALARAALEQRGVAPADVRKHIVLATDNERRASLLLARSEFSAQDLAKVGETAVAAHLRLLYLPGPASANPGRDGFLASFIEAPSAKDFLGHLAYNASPPTDDKPFYFYTLRPEQMLDVLSQMTGLERNNLGVAILLLLLGVSTLLTVVLVILPLALFRRDVLRVEKGAKLRLLAYFLTLGFGFILVELGFMQQFVLFLGHPIYALAVVLSMLLLASGLGSAFSGRGMAIYGLVGFVRRAIACLAGILLLYALVLGHLFHALIGLALPLRIFIAAVLVLVPGLFMGALLPSGVRRANALSPDLVPWAWGLNGAASVVGSILAMTVSMNFGFTMALLIGISVYLLGLLALPAAKESSVPEAAVPLEAVS
jgi:spermidine synthase